VVTLSDAANGYVIADAVRVEPFVVPPIQIVDNGNVGFSKVGNWPYSAGQGYGGDVHYSALGNGSDVARWTFNVTPGRYRVSASWFAHANRASNAPYTVFNGSTALGTVRVSQKVAANDFSDAGTSWENLGGPYDITGNTLVVELSDAANGYVIADAVRIEAQGRTYYIDWAGGNDANDGLSQATPWKHAPGDSAAAGQPSTALVQAGDTVVFRGGVVYRGQIDVSPAQYRDGTAAGHVRLLSGHLLASPWGSGRAVIDGESIRKQGFKINNVDFVRVEGFEIRHMANLSESAGVLIVGYNANDATDSAIVNNYIHHINGAPGASGYGIVVGGHAHRALIQGNEVSYVEEKAVEIYDSNDVVVTNNSLHHTHDHCLVVSGSRNTVTKNIIRDCGYNLSGDGIGPDFTISPTYAIKVDAGTNLPAEFNLIANNLIYNVASGLGVLSADYNYFYNNTVYYNNFGALNSGPADANNNLLAIRNENPPHPPTGNQFLNNIFFYTEASFVSGCSNCRFTLHVSNYGNDNLIRHNIFFQPDRNVARHDYATNQCPGAYGTNCYVDLPNFEDGSGDPHRFEAFGSGNSFRDNLFVEPGLEGGGYATLITSGTLPQGWSQTGLPDGAGMRLTSSSPAVNTGAAVTGVPDDVAGVTRPQGAGWDIGAYEFE
jgi:hypothetical protein